MALSRVAELENKLKDAQKPQRVGEFFSSAKLNAHGSADEWLDKAITTAEAKNKELETTRKERDAALARVAQKELYQSNPA